ncbi:hypothetical protein D3C85_681720 [compost metagenome]
MKYNSISEFLQNASDEERKEVFEAILKEAVENQQRLEIPKRHESAEAVPKPNNLTVEESLVKIYERYEQTFKELSKNEN